MIGDLIIRFIDKPNSNQFSRFANPFSQLFHGRKQPEAEKVQQPLARQTPEEVIADMKEKIPELSGMPIVHINNEKTLLELIDEVCKGKLSDKELQTGKYGDAALLQTAIPAAAGENTGETVAVAAAIPDMPMLVGRGITPGIALFDRLIKTDWNQLLKGSS